MAPWRRGEKPSPPFRFYLTKIVCFDTENAPKYPSASPDQLPTRIRRSRAAAAVNQQSQRGEIVKHRVAHRDEFHVHTIVQFEHPPKGYPKARFSRFLFFFR